MSAYFCQRLLWYMVDFGKIAYNEIIIQKDYLHARSLH